MTDAERARKQVEMFLDRYGSNLLPWQRKVAIMVLTADRKHGGKATRLSRTDMRKLLLDRSPYAIALTLKALLDDVKAYKELRDAPT